MRLEKAISNTEQEMRLKGELVHTEKWQSWDISQRPEAQMVEILHHTLRADMAYIDTENNLIGANLPWAEDHFMERVGGLPLNPGVEWRNWPWGNYADDHRSQELFNHNYMERYWPKFAGRIQEPVRTSADWDDKIYSNSPHSGIRHPYGDLDDLIRLIAVEPSTRQAYFPVWFPEDTGTTHRDRKPCTIGYHFIIRNNKLDVVYYIRSCDMYRHMKDDIYLTIRLAQHILEAGRKLSTKLDNVILGEFIMHITSLHMFVGDFYKKYGTTPGGK